MSYLRINKSLTSILKFQHATLSAVVPGLDLFRVWYGPLPSEFCQLCLLLKGTIFYAIPFIIAGIVIIKLLYICVWQGFRQMNDDLLVRIIIILACFWGFYMQLTKNISPGKPVYNTVFCTVGLKYANKRKDAKTQTLVKSEFPATSTCLRI